MEHEAPTSGDPPKEELILAAAMEVFVEKGWNGARMQEIADRAGINKALLHYYFRSKEKIYDRIITRVMELFFKKIEFALEDGSSFETILRTFIGGLIDRIAENPRVPQFILHELALGGKNVKQILTTVIDEQGMTLPRRLFAAMSRELDAGTIQSIDPPQLIITLLGSCIYYFMAEPLIQAMLAHVQPGVEFDRKPFLEQRKESIFNVIYYGLKVRAEQCRK
ncbi:MAG TPA: TetR family transcriptional regulator [Spirochaetia bacterium]|nr:TetR family transcriptional regulator [Spirochaetia bacterium]